ncbi:MAG: MGMT family protein [Chloroflexi bacterium]|mgnify:CR=1 FL=1|nr:MGMT family protein [Chloroflexota bacterium]
MSSPNEVYALIKRVPAGKVITYGQIARALANPRAARAVGWAMAACPPEVPWQRVPNARGGISQRSLRDHESLQRELLAREGVCPDASGCYDLARYGWRG